MVANSTEIALTYVDATPSLTATLTPTNAQRTTWTPGFTGFVTAPTVTSATWHKDGGMVTVNFVQNALGTSNANTFTITGLPFAPVNAMTGLFSMFAADGGANIGLVYASLAGTTLTLAKDLGFAGNTWTATATAKGVYSFTLVYPYS